MKPAYTDAHGQAWSECEHCHTCSPASLGACSNPACNARNAQPAICGTLPASEGKDSAPAHDGPESALQRDCERWLQAHGYWPRSGKWLTGDLGQPPAGWYVHLHQCEGNPCLLDLLILANDGRYLELELKRAREKPSREQRTILNGRDVIRDAQTFAEIVTAWQKEGVKR